MNDIININSLKMNTYPGGFNPPVQGFQTSAQLNLFGGSGSTGSQQQSQQSFTSRGGRGSRGGAMRGGPATQRGRGGGAPQYPPSAGRGGYPAAAVHRGGLPAPRGGAPFTRGGAPAYGRGQAVPPQPGMGRGHPVPGVGRGQRGGMPPQTQTQYQMPYQQPYQQPYPPQPQSQPQEQQSFPPTRGQPYQPRGSQPRYPSPYQQHNQLHASQIREPPSSIRGGRGRGRGGPGPGPGPASMNASLSLTRDESMRDETSTQEQQSTVKKSLSQPPKNQSESNQIKVPFASQSQRETRSNTRQVPASLVRSSTPQYQQSQRTPSYDGPSLSSRSNVSSLEPPYTKHQTPSYRDSTPANKPSKETTPKSIEKPPAKKQEDYDDEDDYDDYYDDEYGEDEQDEESPPQKPNKVVEPLPPTQKSMDKSFPTKQDLMLLTAFKKSRPEAGKLCLRFVTDSCKFGPKCHDSHDKALKAEILNLLTMKNQMFDNEEPEMQTQPKKSSISPPPSKEAASQKQHIITPKPFKDLRAIIAQSDEIEPQEEKKKDDSQFIKPKEPEAHKSISNLKAAAKKTLGAKKPLASKEETKAPKPEKDLDYEILPPAPFCRIPSITTYIQPVPSSKLTSTVIQEKIQLFIKEFSLMKSEASKYIIPGVALVVGMCPESEIQLKKDDPNPFQRDISGGNFENLAIKAYKRNAADKQMNEPTEIRPPAVLFKTVEYMRECIADLDRLADKKNPLYNNEATTFNSVYSFFRDRAKSIDQDFRIINQPDNEFKIRSLEQLTRFMIQVYHDAFNIEQFDFKTHNDIINSNLTLLIESYNLIRGKYHDGEEKQRLLKNEVEFRCYQILSFANQFVETTKCLVDLDFPSYTDLNDHELLKKAIKLSVNILNQRPAQYFLALKRETNYLFACWMLKYLNEMRKLMLVEMIQGEYKQVGVEISYPTKILIFDQEEDAISFIKACGFTKFEENKVFNQEKNTSDKQQLVFQKWLQVGRLSFMDRLRGSKSRCEIMKMNQQSLPVAKPISLPQVTQIVQQVVQPLNVVAPQLIAPSIPAISPLISKNFKTVDPKPLPPNIDEINIAHQKVKEDEEAQRKKEEEAKRLADEAQKKDDADQKAKREKEIQDERLLEEWKQIARRIDLRLLMEEKKPLLLRKRSSSQRFNLQEVLQEEYFNLVVDQLPSSDLQQAFNTRYHQLQFTKSPYTFDLSQGRDGMMKVKMFTHKANKQGSASENMEIMRELLSNGSKFKMCEFPEQEAGREEAIAKEMMGTNLIVVYSSEKSIESDVKKIKNAMSKCPNYAGFSLLWVVNQLCRDQKPKTIIEEKDWTKLIQDSMQDELSLSSLRIVNIYCAPVLPNADTTKRNRLISTQFGSTYSNQRNIVLALIEEELKLAVSAAKVYKPKADVKTVLYKEVVTQRISEATGLRIEDGEVVVKVKKRKQEWDQSIRELAKESEVQVLNYLLLKTKHFLQSLTTSMHAVIAQICQQFKYSDFNNDSASLILTQHDRLLHFLTGLTLFTYLEGDKDPKSVAKHLRDQLTSCNFMTAEEIKEVKKQITHLYLYDSTLPKEHLDTSYKGMMLFKILMHPFLASIEDSKAFLFEHALSEPEPLEHAVSELQEIAKASKHIAPEQKAVIAMKKQQPVRGVLPRKRTQADVLEEELKNEMNPLRLGNKRSEHQVKQALGFLQDACDVIASVSTTIEQKVEQAQKVAADEAKFAARQSVNKRRKVEVGIVEHTKHLEDLEQFMKKSPTTGKKSLNKK